MNKSNGVCKICLVEEETLCHLLYNCSHIAPLWLKIQNLLTELTNIETNLTLDVIITGLRCNDNNENNFLIPFFNLFIHFTKWTLWKHRNDIKYGNGIKKSCDILFDETVNACKIHVNTVLSSKIALKKSFKCRDMLELFKNQY